MAQEKKKRGPGRPPGSKNKKSAVNAGKPENVKKNAKNSSVGGVSNYSKKKKAYVDSEAKVKELQNKRRADKRVIDEIWAIILVAVGVFFIFCTQLKTMGVFGDVIHDILRGLFGIMAYVFPYFIIIMALFLFFQKMQHINGRTAFFTFLIFINMCIINAARFIDPAKTAFGFSDFVSYYISGVEGDPAGAVGMELGMIIVKLIGKPGLIILALAMIIISLMLVVNTPISDGLEKAREKREAKKFINDIEEHEREEATGEASSADSIVAADSAVNRRITDVKEDSRKHSWLPFGIKKEDAIPIPPPAANESKVERNPLPELALPEEDRRKSFVSLMDDNKVGTESVTSKGFGLDGFDVSGSSEKLGYGLDGYDLSSKEKKKIAEHEREKEAYKELRSEHLPVKADPLAPDDTDEIEGAIAAAAAQIPDTDYKLPTTELLKMPKTSKTLMNPRQLDELAAQLENTFRNFNVDAKVITVTQGSSVTRFEVQPAKGVQVSKITKLENDLALNMRARSIRIEAPIPGKAAVGIEIENENSNAVLVRELLSSEAFVKAKSKITFAVGKDISGNDIVADLKSMPHLLIAGATGSGKSVCINTIITSILYKAAPSEVRFVMIDPKVVELGVYNDIPHMLIPVVTDPKKAASALNWAVNEMNQRYEKFAENGVKDLESYNEFMVFNQEPENVLPEIVIIIDELADLMMAASSQVEDAISRLAAKARAAGMHLIVATQRPSVDVVTGVIKANIPSRIAFSVSSQFDSRTILDMSGAEKLLGKGDMLFSPVGSNKPLRVQGPFISEEETKKVISYVKKQADHDYNEEVIKTIEAPSGAGKSGELADDLTDDAIAFILKHKSASVSMLQRRFRIGYNRAARIIDEIEERGIIGPSDGSKPRQVLFTENEYYGSIVAGEDDTETEEDINEHEEDESDE